MSAIYRITPDRAGEYFHAQWQRPGEVLHWRTIAIASGYTHGWRKYLRDAINEHKRTTP